jgi:hypothetical protein
MCKCGFLSFTLVHRITFPTICPFCLSTTLHLASSNQASPKAVIKVSLSHKAQEKATKRSMNGSSFLRVMVCFAAMTLALLDAFLFCDVHFPFSGDAVLEAATAFLREEHDGSLLV